MENFLNSKNQIKDSSFKQKESVCVTISQNELPDYSAFCRNNSARASNLEDCDNLALELKRKTKLSKKVHNRQDTARRFSHLPMRSLVEIEFDKLSYSVREGTVLKKKNHKCILKGLKGKFSSSQLIGILGPSGAGKSSLLNLLAGYRESGMKGEIFVNGKPRDSRRFRKLSCYIMQDDCLFPHLTVMESMMVSANLKLGRGTSSEEKLDIVIEILSYLGLMSCRKTKTLNLSGGQRKRLAIALELVNNPPVMFFDEPTSGLDSVSSYQVLSLLKSLATGGRTVICTIHQPSAKLFEMFNKLYVLASGQCVYDGTVSGLVPFLQDCGLRCPQYHNPADFVIEAVSGKTGEVFTPRLVQEVESRRLDLYSSASEKDPDAASVVSCSSMKDGNFYVKTETNNRNTTDQATQTLSNHKTEVCAKKVGFFTQFAVLFKRTFFCIFRDKLLTHIRLGVHVGLGLLLGALYFDIGNNAAKFRENAAFLFFSQIFIMFAALMPTVLTYPLEMVSFTREHMNHWYSLKAYFFAKTVADIPFQIILPVLYSAIVYFMTSQPLETERFLEFIMWSILTSLVGQSLGLLIGVASKTLQVATFLAPISALPVFLFSGFFVKFNEIPYFLQWISYSSFTRYSFEGTMISIYGRNRSELDCSSDQGCFFQNPKELLEDLDVDESNYNLDLGILFTFFVGLRLLGYIIMRARLRFEK